ncbi:unnamed protein product [Choristocarpus tenellus]
MAGWFNNLGSQVSSLKQTLGEGATSLAHGLQEQVNAVSENFNLEAINSTIQRVEHDITVEEDKMRNDADGVERNEVKILPWESRFEDKSILGQGVMEKIIALSLEESNFTTAPPSTPTRTHLSRTEGTSNDVTTPECLVHLSSGAQSGAQGPPFQLERHTKVAIKMIALDPNLAKVHARLISRMPEETFWCNYFGRVAHIRAEGGLEPLCMEPQVCEAGDGLATSHSEEDKSPGSSSEDYIKMSHSDASSLISSQPAEIVAHNDQTESGMYHSVTIIDKGMYPMCIAPGLNRVSRLCSLLLLAAPSLQAQVAAELNSNGESNF